MVSISYTTGCCTINDDDDDDKNNLRQDQWTTLKCMHLVTRVHFRTGDTEWQLHRAIHRTRKPNAAHKHHGSLLIERELSTFYITGMGIFDPFGSCKLDLDPMGTLVVYWAPLVYTVLMYNGGYSTNYTLSLIHI